MFSINFLKVTSSLQFLLSIQTAYLEIHAEHLQEFFSTWINLEPVILYMELASDNFSPYLLIQIYWWAISFASLLLAIQVSWDPSVTLHTQLLDLIICSNFLSLVNFTTTTFTPFKVFSGDALQNLGFLVILFCENYSFIHFIFWFILTLAALLYVWKSLLSSPFSA